MGAARKALLGEKNVRERKCSRRDGIEGESQGELRERSRGKKEVARGFRREGA